MANLVVKVTEKGLDSTEAKLKKLGNTGSNTEISLARVGKGVATVGTAAVAAAGAVSAFTSAMAKQNIELARSAQAAGLTVKQFQSMALATSTVGINMEQLGSILGDAEERLGDFLATGGGPFQDFVDVMGLTETQAIATATALQDMSGRDVLVEMVRQMEAAGVSGEKMNFALEGMASDARYLLPLLTGNAKELKTLENRFGSLATTVTNETTKSLNGLNTVSLIVAQNMGNTLATALAGVSSYLIKAGQNAAFFWASLQQGTQQQVLSDMAKLSGQMKVLKGEISDLEKGETWINTFFGDSTVDEQIRNRKERLSELSKEYNRLSDTYNNKFGVNAPSLKPNTTPVTVTPVKTVTATATTPTGAATTPTGAVADPYAGSQYDSYILGYQQYADARIAADELIKESAKSVAANDEDLNKLRLSFAQDISSQLIGVLDRDSGAYRAAATLNATLSTYEAANKALAAYPPPYNAIAAGATIGLGLANVAKINSARAQGGQVTAGQAYTVGEYGRETFVPETNGSIIANGKGGSSSNVQVIINNNASGTKATATQDEDGNTYVTIEELPAMIAAEMGNPDSDANRSASSVWRWERS